MNWSSIFGTHNSHFDQMLKRLAEKENFPTTAEIESLVSRKIISRNHAGMLYQQLAHNLEELVEKLNIDPLTQLGNYQAYKYRLDSTCKRIVKGKKTKENNILLIFIDLNNLKLINDNEGHPIGNLALKATADAIRDSVREDDLVFRLHGDEYAVIIRNITQEQVNVLISRLKLSLSQIRFNFNKEGYGTQSIITSAAVGYVYKTNLEPREIVPELLYSKADESMYRHKKEMKTK